MAFSLSESLGRRHISRFSIVCLVLLLVVLPQGSLSAWAWEWDVRWFYLFVIAFLLSSLLVPTAIALSTRLGAMDQPAARKMHTVATPRLGGFAVYGATMLTLLRNFQWSRTLGGLLLGASVIYAIGVWDDLKGAPASARLVGQVLASSILAYFGLHTTFLPHFPGERLCELAITFVWLIGITNAINFLDGIDGLAAGMGTVCSLLFLSVAWPEKMGPFAYAASALAGACLGFIPYNWHKAKLFLGDGGATFIGFMLAGLPLLGNWTTNYPMVALATPALVLGIPIFDMVYTTIARIRRGDVSTIKQWLEFTGKDHFHHRLMKLGMSVPGAVGFILLVNLCIGLGALVIRYTGSRLSSALLLAQTFLFFVVIVVLMLLGRELSLPNDPKSRRKAV